MRSPLRLALVLSFVTPVVLHAQVLTFEGVGPLEFGATPVGNYYNGGAGPNFGIDFSPNARAICLDVAGRECSNTSRGEQGDPGSWNSGLFFQTGSQTFMNRSAGFTSGFSFFYTAVLAAGSVSVYDGLNGTGLLLATLPLPLTPGSLIPACLGNDFCPFVSAGVTFAGTARSVSFGGAASQIVFDDVTFGSATPGNPTTVPEPGTWALLLTGLGALGTWMRRRRAP